MLSSSPVDEPSPRSSQTPVQGPDELHGLDCAPTTPPQHSTPDADSLADSSAAAPTASTIRRLNAEAGSPTRQQSPLRQAVSYNDPPELPFPRRSAQSPLEYYSRNRVGVGSMSFTGDRKGAAVTSDDARAQARAPAWFMRGNGPAAGDGTAQAGSSDSTPTSLRRSQPGSAQSVPKTTPPAGSSRFAFFSSSMSALKGLKASPTPVAVPQDDELMYMDIETALFPPNSPSERDAFSPAAFMNLQMTATGLLNKFQTAYQQRTIAFQELKAEREAQSEEKDEAETRIQHLKMQLEGMARKAAEQEAVMQALMDELNKEKKQHAEERPARDGGPAPSEASTISEDLGAEDDQRRKWRKSSGTAKSDFGFDTDDESVEEASVFSRSRSPTIATSISEVSPVEPPVLAATPKPATLGPPRLSPRSPQPQISTFQRLFKGTATPTDASKEDGANGCRNCQGQDASMAWDTVSLLKDENKGLKHRVGELEEAVEGALDVVNGIGL